MVTTTVNEKTEDVLCIGDAEAKTFVTFRLWSGGYL